MNKYFYVTSPNLISNIYFKILYYYIYKFCDKNDKILDFGGGKGLLKTFLRNKNIKNVVVYDKVKELSEIDNWKNLDFDTMIISQVLYLFKEKEILNLFKEIKEKGVKKIIIAFSTQSIINKIFAFILMHKDAHKNTMMMPEKEEYLIRQHLNVCKQVNFFGLFKVLKLSLK